MNELLFNTCLGQTFLYCPHYRLMSPPPLLKKIIKTKAKNIPLGYISLSENTCKNQKVSCIPNLVPFRVNSIVNKINIGLLPRIPAYPQHL